MDDVAALKEFENTVREVVEEILAENGKAAKCLVLEGRHRELLQIAVPGWRPIEISRSLETDAPTRVELKKALESKIQAKLSGKKRPRTSK